jgi:hypothetical protein
MNGNFPKGNRFVFLPIKLRRFAVLLEAVGKMCDSSAKEGRGCIFIANEILLGRQSKFLVSSTISSLLIRYW